MTRIGLLILAAALLAAPAHASGGGGKDHGPSNRVEANFSIGGDLDDIHAGTVGESPRAVDIHTVGMPAFDKYGRLSNYLFVSVRLIVAEGVDPWRVRERSHVIRDAMIRAAHAESVADPDDPAKLDTERAREILTRGIAGAIDPDWIGRVEFLAVDTNRIPGT